jgi:glycosyltransferase involved in cell wall biosynthesis
MNKISLLLITKNEEENLKRWKIWVKKIKNIDEIIAVDCHSTDNTQNILKELGAKIFSKELDNDFSSQRNFAISKSKNDWILFFDADEKPSESLISWINNFDFSSQVYAFKRNLIYIDIIISHGQTKNDYPVRLFKKNSGKFIRPVHETFDTKFSINKISHPINHYSAPNLKIFLTKINLYSTIRAQELFEEKAKVNSFDLIFYPLLKFKVLYFLKLGFLDGLPGLIICLSLSFHSFLVRSKLWRLYHA